MISGKNLVDIILSNNGYKVVNLGIKQPIDAILAAANEHKPDAIGMSGLLVKSTLVMKENLQEMTKQNLSIPVVCGGAALTRAYVEVDLRKAYPTGQVFTVQMLLQVCRLWKSLQARSLKRYLLLMQILPLKDWPK